MLPRDGALAQLAARQHGVVCRRQLAAAGLGQRAIDGRLASGRLHPVHRGVYAVGHPLLSARGRWLAAVLAAGPGALLSHHSAAALWDLLATNRALVDVTVPHGRHARPGLSIHRARRLPPADRTELDAIPVTALARTLLDLAVVLPADRLERAVEAAERLRLFDMAELDDLRRQSRGRRGLHDARSRARGPSRRAAPDALRARTAVPHPVPRLRPPRSARERAAARLRGRRTVARRAPGRRARRPRLPQHESRLRA